MWAVVSAVLLVGAVWSLGLAEPAGRLRLP
jgi:hypothetical protein